MDLIAYIKEGNIKKVRSLADDSEKFAEAIKFVDSEGMTSLHHACKGGYLPIVKLILTSENSGNLINLQDTKQGWTPLIYTIYSQDDGGPEIAALLLDTGADPNLKDKEGNTALHHAAAYGAGDTIEFLSKNKRSDPNIQNNKGETPTHMAIRESQMWAFQTLLKSGSKVDLKTVEGETLAHFAAKSIGNAPQFLRILQSKGLDLNTKDNNGKTPYQFAKEKNIVRVINAFKELGIQDEENVSNTPKTQNENNVPQPTILNKQEKTLEDKLKLLIYILVVLLIPVLFASVYKAISNEKMKASV